VVAGVEASPLILTIRAKKADIDAYSTGKMTEDQFRQRSVILMSPAHASSGARQSETRFMPNS